MFGLCWEVLQFRLQGPQARLTSWGGEPDCDSPVRLRLSLSGGTGERVALAHASFELRGAPPATSNQAHVPGARRVVDAARRVASAARRVASAVYRVGDSLRVEDGGPVWPHQGQRSAAPNEISEAGLASLHLNHL